MHDNPNKEKHMSVKLLPHQHEFVLNTDTRYLALIGGFGAGKTRAFCYKAIHLASLNVGHVGVLLEPINTMLHDVLIPEFEDALIEAGVPYKYKASPLPQFTLQFATGECTILMRSGENYRRLAGLNIAFFGVDECDTISHNTAVSMWRMCMSRLRRGSVYQGFTTSTPEGFGFLYEFFEKDGHKPDRSYIRARTRDNPFLPPDFIQSLLDNYPAELVEAYLEGKFVNLTSGRIYYKFDRKLNNSDYTVEQLIAEYSGKKDIYGRSIPLPSLHIGMDFNVNKMAAVIHIIDDLGPIAVDEVIGARDTEQMIEILQERYPQFNMIVYPDSSGQSRHTNNTSQTDIALLKQAGFSVSVGNTNPPVKDRINSMNVAFLDNEGVRRYRVNVSRCKDYTAALEQQVYDKHGQPDKTQDNDHPNDAAGYFIYARFPVRRYKSGGLRMIGT